MCFNLFDPTLSAVDQIEHQNYSTYFVGTEWTF